MTREVKIGTAVAGSFLSLVGIVVGTKMYKGDIPPSNPDFVANAEKIPQKPEPKNPSDPSKLNKLLQTSATDLNPPAPPAEFQASLQSGVNPPPPLGPTSNGSAVPSIPAPPTPIVEFGNEIERNLEEQQRKAKELRDREFAPDKAFGTSPPPMDPGKISIPLPFEVADNTITGRKPGTPSDPPQPPLNFNNNPPAAPDVQKSPIVGQSATPPNSPQPKPNKDSTPPPPPSDSKDPAFPARNLSLPPAGAPVAPNPPLPQSPGPGPQPFIQAPSTPIVATKTNDLTAPQPPAVNNVQGAPTNTNPPQTQFGNPFGTTTTAPPPPPAQSIPPIPGPPSQFTNNPPQSDQFPSLPNTNGTPFGQPVAPVVRVESPKRVMLQGNDNFDQIAAREYPASKVNLGRALEEYNREFPSAPDALRAQPARLQPGMSVMVPSQEYLLETYGRFAPGSVQSIPTTAQIPGPRPFGNEVNLRPPTPAGNLPPRPATTTDAGVKEYRVPEAGMYLSKVAERQLGSPLRWIDIYRLNPGLQPEQPLIEGTILRVPVK